MILIIDNFDSFTYNLYQQVAKFTSHVKVLTHDIDLDTIRALKPQGIILSPGPGSPADSGICLPLLLAILNAEMPCVPILGVCLGHQVIVHACDGDVIQATEMFHGEVDHIFHHRHDLFINVSFPMLAGRYHSLIASHKTLPACLEQIAETAKGEVMAVAHRDFPFYGVQFHPESILTSDGDVLIKNFLNKCQDYMGALCN